MSEICSLDSKLWMPHFGIEIRRPEAYSLKTVAWRLNASLRSQKNVAVDKNTARQRRWFVSKKILQPANTWLDACICNNPGPAISPTANWSGRCRGGEHRSDVLHKHLILRSVANQVSPQWHCSQATLPSRYLFPGCHFSTSNHLRDSKLLRPICKEFSSKKWQ